MRRFGVSFYFRLYPFGALVFYVHPKKLLFHGSKSTDGHVTKKWRSRFVLVIFIGITVGPGCRWGQSCKVVPLASLLSEDRASRVSIRTVMDVIFPEVDSWIPFLYNNASCFTEHMGTRRRLHMITDDTENWAVIEDGGT